MDAGANDDNLLEGEPDDRIFFPPSQQHVDTASHHAGPTSLVSPLSRVPTDIGLHREALFELAAPVQFDQDAWQRYWPYVFLQL